MFDVYFLVKVQNILFVVVLVDVFLFCALLGFVIIAIFAVNLYVCVQKEAVTRICVF